jgi:GntR family transcriptional regulator
VIPCPGKVEEKAVTAINGQSSVRRIDKNSQIPYYYQLGEILKEEIELGRWAPGELIPSEAGISESYAVSRTVIRKALDMLEADGAVIRIKGKGTMVAQPKFHYEAVAAAGEWSRSAPVSESRLQRVVDIRDVPAGAHVGRVLKTTPTEVVFELTVVQSVGGQAASFSQIYLRKDATPALRALAGPSPGNITLTEGGPDVLAQLASNYGLVLGESLVTVEVSLATEFEAGLIGIPIGAPVFLLSSVDIDIAHAPVSFTRAIVRADYFRFSVGIHYPTVPLKSQEGWGVMSLMAPRGGASTG